MRSQVCRFRTTIQSTISAHRRTRLFQRNLHRYADSSWYFLLYPMTKMLKLREARLLKKLIAVDAVGPDEARAKLLYLAALMAARSFDPSPEEVQTAIDTLRPFRTATAATLSKRRNAAAH